MCDTSSCPACRGHANKRPSMTGQIVIGLVDVVLVGGWWLARRVLWPATMMLGWAAFVWFTGRTWRHEVARRLVRREVRAAGQTLLAIVAAAAVWNPVLTGTVLAILGGSLVTTALTWRHGHRLLQLTGLGQHGRGPIRVRAVAGIPRRSIDRSGT